MLLSLMKYLFKKKDLFGLNCLVHFTCVSLHVVNHFINNLFVEVLR